MKGGQSQRREVECGEGVPSPLKKGSGEGAVPPPQKLKKIVGSMCSKKFWCSDQGGGHRPVPPLNTPLRVGSV